MPHHFVLDVRDPLGRRITLTPETWDHHVQRRPELRGSVDFVKTAVMEPDFTIRTPDGANRYYRRGVNTAHPWVLMYFHLLVRFEDASEGRIASAWYSNRPEPGEILWVSPGLMR